MAGTPPSNEDGTGLWKKARREIVRLENITTKAYDLSSVASINVG